MYRQLCFFVFVLCYAVSIAIQLVEAGTAKKIAKAVAKNAIKPRRRFPIWGIVLLILGLSGIIGLGLFLFCFLRRRFSQGHSAM